MMMHALMADMAEVQRGSLIEGAAKSMFTRQH